MRIMRYWLRFYCQWSYVTLLLIQTLQNSALLSVELITILTMWHHKNKEKSKKQQFCGFQRKVDTVLKYTISFWFFCLTSQILAFEILDGYFLGVAGNALILARNSCFFYCTVQSPRTIRPIRELKKIKHCFIHWWSGAPQCELEWLFNNAQHDYTAALVWGEKPPVPYTKYRRDQSWNNFGLERFHA